MCAEFAAAGNTVDGLHTFSFNLFAKRLNKNNPGLFFILG